MRVIRGRKDLLYDPCGHCDFGGRFDLVYDPKRSQGHKRSPWPTLWPGHGDLCGRFDLVYDLKRSRSLEVAVAYFMTPNGYGDLFGRFDRLYDPQNNDGRFDLVYDPKGQLEL